MKKRMGIGIIIFIIFYLLINSILKKRDNQLIDLDIQEVQHLEKHINNFIDNKIINETRGSLFFQNNDVKTFYNYIILGSSKTKIYVWMIKADYYLEESNIQRSNVVILPVIFKYKQKNNTTKIRNYSYPRDGENNGKDKSKMFPPEIRIKFHDDETNGQLEIDLDKKAYDYYHKIDFK